MDASLPERLAATVRAPEARPVRAQRAADLIRIETGVRWVGIYTVAAGRVTNVGWSGPAPPAHPSFSASQGLTSYAIQSLRLIVSNDVASDPRYLTNQEDSGSELIVPVLSEAAVVGTLDVESAAVNAFPPALVGQFDLLAQELRPLWEEI